MSAGAILLCFIVGIADGDTLTARCDGSQEVLKVRLAEIDAPERRQPWGKQSKASLSEICYLKDAKLRVIGHDRYGRIVARTTCNGTDSSHEQVRRGMAWVYIKYAKDESLYQVQEMAKSTRLGLWAETNPIPPWEFRKSKSSKSDGVLFKGK